MAKKKRAGATKRAGVRRKAAAPRRKKIAKRRTTPRDTGRVDLKVLRRQLEDSVQRLEKLPTRDVKSDVVRGRLERMAAELADLCDPNNVEGCHPTMVFPPAAES